MAGQPPDVRVLSSWEDAFQHPLPVVRKLEQQLRKNIDENRQKLRSLVGASYRDLLGTAERIIEMDERVQTVETYLGDIGKKCNARMVERIADNHTRMWKTKEARVGDEYRAVAQTKVLQNALIATARIVRANGDALRASKLLVLSRLLLNSISEGPQPPVVLAELKQKLNALRSKLLSYIERSMVLRNVDKKALGHTLCAYALVTSSSPKEVLRHFLQVRYDQLDNDTDSPSDVDITQMLDLYSQTLFDTRELFPRRFADALSQLSKVPLLKDEQILSIPALNIDIYRSWIADDIRTFTPWIRHDQLNGNEVADALASWTKQAQTCLLTGLRNHLEKQGDAHDILVSRHTFLSKFIGLSSRLKNATSASAIQDLRVTFSARLEELAVQAAQIANLTLIESDISTLAESDTDESTIWDLASADSGVSHGAFTLRGSIVKKRHGRSARIESQTEKLDNWMQRINSFLDVAEEMRSSKWDDDLDLDLDDLDEGESLQQRLSKDDPDHLREVLRDATRKTFNDIVTKIAAAATSTRYPCFYLRMWREIDLRRRALEFRLKVPTEQISLIELHKNISHSVSEESTREYVRAAKLHTHPAVTLWDGSPPLPVQPFPATFRYLISLHKAMSTAGSDLWTTRCVGELKGILLASLASQLDDEVFTHPVRTSELTNGHVEDEERTMNDEEEKEEEEGDNVVVQKAEPDAAIEARLIQHLFDLQYLRHVLHRPGQEVGNLDTLVEAMREKAELDEVSNERLKKNARDYWKRTYLLFGLLAPDSKG